jgi:PAS domain S-box-containing protein
MAETQSITAPEYLAAIVESSDDGILSRDLNGIIQSCNAAAERIFGYTAAELIGQPVQVLIPPERQAEEDDILGRIRRGERVDHFETVRVTKDQRRIDVSLTVSPVRDGSGVVIGASKIARDITEQKRARGTEAYLAAIIESSEDAILSKDLDGFIQTCNPTAEQLFGYSASELIGRSIRILIPPDRQPEEDEILAKVRRGERVQHFETVRIAKDGRALDISLSVSPVRDASGAVVGVAKSARDITEQKRLRRELTAQQEWFRVTLGSIGDGVIASDPDGRVTYMNAHAEALTGWTSHAATGRALADVFRSINEKTRQPVENPADLVIRSGHVAGLANHTLLISRDGTQRPIADSAAPIRDGAGRIIGVVLIFRDVTEERKVEDAIAEQREWFETTLESIGDAVIATDERGRVAFMNPIAERLTGWRLAQARGRSCSDVFRIVDEESRGTVESPVTRALAEGAIVGLANHIVLVAADGTECPIDDSAAPIRSRDGRIVGVVLVFRDVTERRRMELERRSGARERERLLEAERTARADAERASRVKDEFVAMMSHELRTPLNAIIGWTQLMSNAGTDTDLLRRGVDVIARNTRVQAQLISDLLDISRIVSGKLRLTMERVDLESIIRDAIEIVQQSANDKRITIEHELPATTGTIAGDRARVEQIVWNLLSNAIKFTPEGGRVVIRLRQAAGAGAEITVTDTGMGIRQDFLPHIFERFQQADRTITKRFGGLGLGLAIVKHLVELHGGTITADSAGEGHGATFVVVLPASVLPETVDGIAESDARTRESSEPAVCLDGVRVLIVEDEPDTSEFIRRFLVTHGADVVTASSAAEALSLLPASGADILVSDIGLPEVDGYELIQRIRRMDAKNGGGIPAVALTAYARSEDRALALRAGYQAHLAKPAEPAELLATIARFAGSSRGKAGAADA